MSSSAAQLPSHRGTCRHRGSTCRHRGAVIGCRAPKTLQLERGLGRPAGGRRCRGRRGCPDAGHAVRRSLRRADVRPTGRADVRCPGDRCPRVRCPGDRCDPGIRTDRRPCPRPLRPRCPHRAGSRTSVPRDRPRWRTGVRRVAVGPRAAWSSLPESGLGRPLAGKGWSCAGNAWRARGSTAGLGCRFAVAQAGAPRSPPGRPRELVQRQGAGRLAGEHGREQVLTSPSQVRLGQVVGVMLDMGRDRKVVTTLGGRCAGVGLGSSGAGGPVRFSGA
jgi:hypothetical protein